MGPPEKKWLTERKLALNNLINGTATSGWEKLLVIFFPSLIVKKRARRLIQQSQNSAIHAAPIKWKILIRPYQGNNPTAVALRHVIQSQAGNEVADVILFGSYADATACPYSDLDCLIVLNDHTLSSENRLHQIALKLFNWRKLLLRTDMLQHHGWLVAFQSDQLCWDQTFLPVSALEDGCSLLHNQSYELELFTPTHEDFHTPFLQLCHRMMKTSPSSVQRMNIYELKTWLSRFFLIPALFCQALYQKGISKKDSFQLAKSHFSEAQWQPVDDLSRCRLEWKQPLPFICRWLIECSFNWPLPMRRYFYPPAPSVLKQRIIAHLPAIHDLLQMMIKKVGNHYTSET